MNWHLSVSQGLSLQHAKSQSRTEIIRLTAPEYSTSLIFILFVFVICIDVQAYSKRDNRNVHDFVDCQECHDSGLDEETISAKNIAEASNKCTACHQNILLVTHPYDVKVSNQAMPDLPLDEDGRITCNTCHELHSTTDGLLRTGKNGMEFCILCHTEEFFKNMYDSGISLINATHLKTTMFTKDAGLDYISIQCLGCHSENSYTSQFLDFTKSLHLTNGMVNNHRVGVMYSNYSSFGGYKPIELVSEDIILPDGKVSCISCHQGYGKKHGELVVSLSGSELCMNCHDL